MILSLRVCGKIRHTFGFIQAPLFRHAYLFILTFCSCRGTFQSSECDLHVHLKAMMITISIKVYTKDIFNSHSRQNNMPMCQLHACGTGCILSLILYVDTNTHTHTNITRNGGYVNTACESHSAVCFWTLQYIDFV